MPTDDTRPPAGTPPPEEAPAPKAQDPLLAVVPCPALERLQEGLPGRVGEPHFFAGEVTLTVAMEHLLEVCEFLRQDPACCFELLADLTGTDFLGEEKRFRVVYHLASLKHGQRLRLRTQVGEGESLASVTPIWPGADWFEREAYDLLGIRFDGHPRLVRILMPDDWVGHPLRKDYPLPGYPEHHLRYRTADVTRRSYVDISWKVSGERAAAIVKKYKGKSGAPESAPHAPMPADTTNGQKNGS